MSKGLGKNNNKSKNKKQNKTLQLPAWGKEVKRKPEVNKEAILVQEVNLSRWGMGGKNEVFSEENLQRAETHF